MALDAIPREKVLTVIARLGPVQPIDVRRELGEGDTMLIGAILSEMAASGHVAISRTKRGGSPFYYDPEKPETLEKLHVFLNEKDQRTYRTLREEGVLKEDELDPLTRVSLSNIQDFSRRFSSGGQAFWRYYLLPEAEALEKTKPPAQPQQVPQHAEEEEVVKRKVENIVSQTGTAPVPEEILRVSGSLADKIQALGRVQSLTEVKRDQELHGTLVEEGVHGKVTYLVFAYSRKTLPETMVWKALLRARSEGLPLLICKDSPFPKSLKKKFSDIPNVYFKVI